LAMAVPPLVALQMGVYWVFSQVPAGDVEVLVEPPAVAPPVASVDVLPPVSAAVEELPPVSVCGVVVAVVASDVLPPEASDVLPPEASDVLPPDEAMDVWPPVASLPPAGFCDVAGLLLDEHPSVPSKAPSVSIETADVI
jgi:hypothetical protein